MNGRQFEITFLAPCGKFIKTIKIYEIFYSLSSPYIHFTIVILMITIIRFYFPFFQFSGRLFFSVFNAYGTEFGEKHVSFVN